MDKGIGLFVGLTALFAMGSALAADVVVCTGDTPSNLVTGATNPQTGHYFEVYKADEIPWLTANSNTETSARTCGGVSGHLATITSSGEEAFVDEFRHNSLSVGLDQPQVWVGGSRDGGGWRWVNNEGPFPGTNDQSAYANWATDEPNNSGGLEDHVTLGRYDTDETWVDNGWNDEGAAASLIGGYIVEYDVPRAAACTGVDCQTIDGQTLVFPTGSFTGGDSIKFTAYEFTDPRVLNGKCTEDRGPLTLFTDEDAFGLNAQLRIPPYLCGSPKFVVVAVDSSQLDILKGAVLVENETDTVLPDNLYKCFEPILGRDPALTGLFLDPQYQDVVVWQSTDPANMLENTFGGTGIYQGAATEATNGCGSTVAKVRGASYFVVGMHIDFDLGSDYPANAADNYQQFVALTRYKLTLLKKSIAAARLIGSLRPAVSTAMDALIALAIYRLDHGNPAGALIQVKQFLWLVNAATYTPKPNVNYNGDHLMRGENIAFTLRVKVIPYKQP